MHTLAVVGGGLVLLALFVLGRNWIPGAGQATPAGAAKAFVPVWLILSLINMWVGVSRAGYTVAQELPILLIVFGLPAVAALVLARRMP